jgi:hypothetical protein
MNLLQKIVYNPPFPDKNLNKSLKNFSKSQVFEKEEDIKTPKQIFKHTNFKNKDENETIKISAHPNSIKNYMYNNNFYFDLKNWKEFNKPTHITTKVQMRSTNKPIKEPIFKDRKESKKLKKIKKNF